MGEEGPGQRRRKWRRRAINIQQQVQGSASLPLLCNMSEAQDGIIRPQIGSSMWGWSFPGCWRMAPPSNEGTGPGEIGEGKKSGWWKQNGGKMRTSTRCFTVLSGGSFLFSPPSVAAVRFYDQVKTLAGAAPSGWFNSQRRPTLIFQFCFWKRGSPTPLGPAESFRYGCVPVRRKTLYFLTTTRMAIKTKVQPSQETSTGFKGSLALVAPPN